MVLRCNVCAGTFSKNRKIGNSKFTVKNVYCQFMFATFLMEAIMNDFWWPLEASCIALLPKIADFEKEVLKQSGLDIGGVLQVLRAEIAGVLISYFLSIFFLVCALHATRIIDLRLLR